MPQTEARLPRLAIDGGEPVRRTRLPYGHHSLTEEDIAAVVATLRSDWITTGPKVEEFEAAFALRVDATAAVAFSSGTAALHGAAFAAGVGPGDEVITTPLTFCATANCVLYQGGTPVFADVTDDTLNLDPAAVARAVTTRTKAILPVDYAGHPAALDEMLAIAERHRLTVIEDASHAPGATYRGRAVGSVAHMTVFSFHPVKHLTTGEGGMVTTNDPALARRLRQFRNHGIDSDARARQAQGSWWYDMTELGFNYRLPDIACALGLSQIPRLTANIARRCEIARRYDQGLAGLHGLRRPVVRDEVTAAWHLYPIRVEAGKVRRDRVFQALVAEGIGVNVHYIPVHKHSYYTGRFGARVGLCPIAETAADQLISLPMFHRMREADVDDVIEAVRKVMTGLSRE